tara:strand:- start:3900 stop:4181 length:282 start_codon:yes stop_codon:yes gene_type:complete
MPNSITFTNQKTQYIMRESHKTRLLAYLKQHGSITSHQSIEELGNTRLAASIFCLREDGHSIKTESISSPTRWGGTTLVAKYVYNNQTIKQND